MAIYIDGYTEHDIASKSIGLPSNGIKAVSISFHSNHLILKAVDYI